MRIKTLLLLSSCLLGLALAGCGSGSSADEETPKAGTTNPANGTIQKGGNASTTNTD